MAKQVIGIISDTHGLLRPQALAELQGVDMIIHGGDIGGLEILKKLGQIAPVTVVRGNNDWDSWASVIPETQTVEVSGFRLFVIHNLKELAIDPHEAGLNVVIAGHSHKPLLAWRDGILFLNPGSAGPIRFKLPIALARLTIENNQLLPEIIELAV